MVLADIFWLSQFLFLGLSRRFPLQAMILASLAGFALLYSPSSPYLPGSHPLLHIILSPWHRGFALLLFLISPFIVAYSKKYFENNSKAPTFFFLLHSFFLACQFVFLTDHLWVFVLGWEATSLLSFWLIRWDDTPKARRSSWQALITTSIGGVALLGAAAMAYDKSGSLILSQIFSPSAWEPTPFFVILIVIAAFTKSAIFPFHAWLPKAMAAPSPVSAYLHSATLVKCGIFLMGIAWPLLSKDAIFHRAGPTLGLISAIIAGIQALRKSDVKEALAYATLAQLGFLAALFGVMNELSLEVSLLSVWSHALYKAPLFLMIGKILYYKNEASFLKSAPRLNPIAKGGALILALLMLPLPGLFPSFAKDSALALLTAPLPREGVMYFLRTCCWLIVFLQAFFAAKFFRWIYKGSDSIEKTSPWLFVPPIVIGSLAIMISPIKKYFVAALIPDAALLDFSPSLSPAIHWTPLILVIFGAVVGFTKPFLLGQSKEKESFFQNPLWKETVESIFIYLQNLRGPQSLFLILVAGLLFYIQPSFPELRLESLSSLSLLCLIFGLAALTLLIKMPMIKRFLVLGFLGILCLMIFIILGAPDLTLTLLWIEGFSILFLVLGWVINKEESDENLLTDIKTLLSLLLAFGIVGVFANSESASSMKWASRYYFENAAAAGGTNLVNMVIVDFRGMDTLIEITVLALAYLGSLYLSHTKPLMDSPLKTAWTASGSWPFFGIIGFLSLWLFLRGHHAPGGGFIAGLAASALSTLLFFFRHKEIPCKNMVVTGLSIAYLTALIPLALGSTFFQSAVFFFGPSSIIFDIGVFLATWGSVTGLTFELWRHHEERTSHGHS